ncbi:2463_t:CDS:2 [Ambispora leptoticha]|uniref:2463_t:CDS:1 n=1 Tax=Ambispora leptoticha TaxID=144679 RepID=A0A9N9FUP7_9GLOM|nr:2463_t:CDS:2 [Ambispora leptoticha]
MEVDLIFQLLPVEIRQEIFKNLNKASLFKCLLVNRQWCREVVSILWEKPLAIEKQEFRYQNCFNRRNILSADTLVENARLTKIINVYVGLFTKETWKSLNKNEISRPRTIRAPTFNYASFLRHYEPNAIPIAAGAWLKQKIDPPTNKQQQKRNALSNAVCQLFLTEAKFIQSFYYNWNEDVEICSPVPRECQSHLPFNRLKELKISGITSAKALQNFFENLTGVSHAIRRISINSTDNFAYIDINDNQLKSTMLTQYELEWLELNSSSYNIVKSICSGLQYSSRTFRAIKFYKISFAPFRSKSIIKGLRSCVNLLCLDFHDCLGIEQNAWIETAKFFTKLEFLAIVGASGSYERIPLAFIKQIVETSGDNLQYLLIKENRNFCYIIDGTIAEELLTFIHMHSQNLRALSLSGLNLKQLPSLQEPCPKLEHIDLDILKINEDLTSLAQFPPQISSLGICGSAFYFYGFNTHFLKSIRGHIKYISIDCEGIDASGIEHYGFKFNKKSFYDRIRPSYFPQF